MIRSVAIDIDDTLCLTESACFELENEVLRELAREPMTRRIHLSTWGEPLLDAMEKRSPGIDLARFDAIYRVALGEYIASGRLDVIPQENVDALDRLQRAGRHVVLLTSRAKAEVEHMLAPGHVLANRVSAIYHAGNTRFRKPDPRAFEEFLLDVGLDPSECVYVGDSPGDASAAHGAGLHFVACLQSGVRRSQDFVTSHVAAFIDRFPEIVDVVRRLDDSTNSRAHESLS